MGLISASTRTLTRTIGGVSVTLAKLSYRDRAALLEAEFARLGIEPTDEDSDFILFINGELGAAPDTTPKQKRARQTEARVAVVEFALNKANPSAAPEDVAATAEELHDQVFRLVLETCNLAVKEAPSPLTEAGTNQPKNPTGPSPVTGPLSGSDSPTGSET